MQAWGQQENQDQVSQGLSDTEWAGKKLKFRIAVRAVEESILPELDQAFFQQCGVEEGGLDRLKELFREGMQHELEKKLRQNMKDNVMDLLVRRNDIALPPALVQSEIERMRAGMVEQLRLDEEQAAKLDEQSLQRQAKTQRKTRYNHAQVADTRELEVGNREFEAGLEQIAARYEDAETVRQHYRSDPLARSKLTGLILEEKVFPVGVGSGTVGRDKRHLRRSRASSGIRYGEVKV